MQKIVVALTSYPKRINMVRKVIESLWTQRVRADEIILYLTDTEFPRREGELPVELNRMVGKNGFTIEWVEDNLKSHKKYFYALQNKRNDIVITVDDDVIYAETFINDLICSYKKFPKAVSARAVRIVLKDGEKFAEYNEWDTDPKYYADMPRMDLCAIGYAGVLYPPLCASDRWFDKEKINELAEYQDDLWLKCNEIIEQIPVVYVKPAQNDILIEEAEATALCTGNMCEGKNNDSVVKLSNWMKENHREIYQEWLSDLIQRGEYWLIKKKEHIDILKKSFDELGNIPIYLYGAGKKARRILEVLCEYGMLDRLRAVIVSDKSKNPDRLETLEVKQIDEIDSDNTGVFGVIYGVGAAYKSEVDSILENYNCICLDWNIY